MTVYPVAQRTEPWDALRLGRLTGSVAADMLAMIKSGEAAKRRDLRLRLACERLTGRSADDHYVSKEMQRGIDLEPVARAAYEARTGRLVRPVGFVAHDELAAGCSPDGEVQGFTGLLEIKCPKMATHLSYWRGGTLPAEYRAQVTHNVWITGARWCDFVSYDDRFPSELQLFVTRVEATRLDLAAYELAARLFLADVEHELAAVRDLRQMVAA